MACESSGDYEEAIVNFNKAIALNFEMPEPRLGLSLVFKKMGQHKEAIEAVEVNVKFL